MTATLHTFPAARIVRAVTNGQPTSPRMSPADLETLQRRWPSGRHEIIPTDAPNVVVDRWHVPTFGGALFITLEPCGTWTLVDDAGELIAKAATVDEIINAASV